MAETLEEKAELAFLEKRVSKIVQRPELGHTVVDYANKIVTPRQKLQELEGKQ
jgi:hypothetical protein